MRTGLRTSGGSFVVKSCPLALVSWPSGFPIGAVSVVAVMGCRDRWHTLVIGRSRLERCLAPCDVGGRGVHGTLRMSQSGRHRWQAVATPKG